ncbi:MBL fold metallo-hydrolase [Devosia sp. A16]|uniref:MBL fold metallo-hydrolase n=1 Tax=Devosia sp. A16 TaxID=1736675 RepID=UPI0006D7FB49|nr:MBL fold metallo-hydrolase [Devosia sp. A16]
MTLTLTVHRGTRCIGGSCIEIRDGDDRLILDVGRPLDAPRDAKGLLPATLDTTLPATVLFSHSHMDHWGLVEELPPAWPLWAGEKSAELIHLSTELFGGRLDRDIHTWTSRSGAIDISGFSVIPILTDHSAFDAYMLLIEKEGRRILYGGDFRTHGRKSSLVEGMITSPPAAIDVLILEGTNLRTDKPVINEAEVEDAFVDLGRETRGHVFVQWSAQNIDRTVTLYRAAKRTGRKLVIDLYGADVLRRIASGTRLPLPGKSFPELKVVITPGGRRLYTRQGRDAFVAEMATSPFATSRKRLVGDKAFIMTRDSMLDDFEKAGLGFTAEDAYAFSNWSGYLDVDDPKSGWARAQAAGSKTVKVHTSGHASPADLLRFAEAMKPAALVPVHGIAWDDPGMAFPAVRRLSDGETWKLP